MRITLSRHRAAISPPSLHWDECTWRGLVGQEFPRRLKRGQAAHPAAQATIDSIRSRAEANIVRDFAHHVAELRREGGVNMDAGVGGASSARGREPAVSKVPASIRLDTLDLFGADAGLSAAQLGEAARLRRSLPYAVKITLRSGRLRVQRAHVLLFLSLLPGVERRVKKVQFSPDLRSFFVLFAYNRFRHNAAAVAAATGGVVVGNGVQAHPIAGVECDGVQAARRHVHCIGALQKPSGYIATHKPQPQRQQPEEFSAMLDHV